MKSAVVITTFNRPFALARSLPQIVAAAREVDAPVLVVDDGSFQNIEDNAESNAIACSDADYAVDYLYLPENRGLAGALNIGLSYWLADTSIEAISYFQDDVEVDPLCIAACAEILGGGGDFVVTGHDAKEHRERGDDYGGQLNGVVSRRRNSCRATHMMATRESWLRIMPIPSRGLGLPGTRIMDGKRGTGSGVDWWIVRDSPNRLPVLCIPGLVRSFAHKAADSTWLNESIGGEEPALNRDAIKDWITRRDCEAGGSI